MDLLITNLIELNNAFKSEKVPLILGDMEKAYLQTAKRIQSESFLGKDEIGFLRMREHPTYQRDAAIYNPHIEKVVEDLRDLFKG